jgi:hypothetical protein
MEESRFAMNGAFLCDAAGGSHDGRHRFARIRSRARDSLLRLAAWQPWLLSDTMQPISMISCRGRDCSSQFCSAVESRRRQGFLVVAAFLAFCSVAALRNGIEEGVEIEAFVCAVRI